LRSARLIAPAAAVEPDALTAPVLWDTLSDWYFEAETAEQNFVIGREASPTASFLGQEQYRLGKSQVELFSRKDYLRFGSQGARLVEGGPSRLRMTLGFTDNRRNNDGRDLRLPHTKRNSSFTAVLDARVYGPFVVRLNTRKTLNGHMGLTHATSLGAVLRKPGRFAVIPEIALTYASEKYMNAFYSVAPSAGRPGFDADGGLRDVSLRITGQYQFNSRWSALGRIESSRLLNDAAASPVMQRAGSRTQGLVGAGLLFSF
jgi:outer membrane scaffolding protein for murein synthesis (MipA/OmpV family)